MGAAPIESDDRYSGGRKSSEKDGDIKTGVVSERKIEPDRSGESENKAVRTTSSVACC